MRNKFSTLTKMIFAVLAIAAIFACSSKKKVADEPQQTLTVVENTPVYEGQYAPAYPDSDLKRTADLGASSSGRSR